jgi:aminoglycoside phosphotransferase (APT) family kinase protein
MPQLTSVEIEEQFLSYIRNSLSMQDIAYIQPPVLHRDGSRTRTYKLRLTGAPNEYTKVLVLRIYNPDESPVRPRFEGLLMNSLAEQGFPAPRTLLMESSADHIGAPFLLMQECRGESMFDLESISEKPYMQAARFLISGVGSIAREVAQLAVRLHLASADKFLERLEALKFPVEHLSLNGRLYQLYKRVQNAKLTELEPGVIWLISHGPPEPVKPSLCHGQFFPNNVKKHGDVVTGVVNWSMDSMLIGDPAYDLGRTSAAFKCAVPDVSPSIRRLSMNVGKRFAKQFIMNYRQQRPVSKEKIRYFEMLWCIDLAAAAGESMGTKPHLLKKDFDDMRIELYKTTANAIELFRETTDISVMLPLLRR